MKRFLICLVSLLLITTAALADTTVTISFTGDVTLGCEERFRSDPATICGYVEKNGYDWCMKYVKDIFEQDDLTVVNFEGVLADTKNGENTKKAYRFRGMPDMAKVLTCSGIELCSLANNHTGDYGNGGLKSTKAALEAEGLYYFGDDEVYITEVKGIRIGFVSATSATVFRKNNAILDSIIRLKEDENCQLVVFCYHGGTEYGNYHDNSETDIATRAIRRGADVVVMHHPHVPFGLDVIGNRTVCYSLGNFCFGGNKEIRNQRALYSAIAQFDFTFNDDGEYTGQTMRLIPCYTSSIYPDNNYQPYPVKGDDAAEVLRVIMKDTEYYPLGEFDEEKGYYPGEYLPSEAETTASKAD